MYHAHQLLSLEVIVSVQSNVMGISSVYGCMHMSNAGMQALYIVERQSYKKRA